MSKKKQTKKTEAATEISTFEILQRAMHHEPLARMVRDIVKGLGSRYSPPLTGDEILEYERRSYIVGYLPDSVFKELAQSEFEMDENRLIESFVDLSFEMLEKMDSMFYSFVGCQVKESEELEA